MVTNSRAGWALRDQLAGPRLRGFQRGRLTYLVTYSKEVPSPDLPPSFLSPHSTPAPPYLAACARSEMNSPSPAGRERQFLSLGTS